MSIVNTARAIGATWKNGPLKEDYSHDLKAMEAAVNAETRFVYTCHPNNPTGTIRFDVGCFHLTFDGTSKFPHS